MRETATQAQNQEMGTAGAAWLTPESRNPVYGPPSSPPDPPLPSPFALCPRQAAHRAELLDDLQDLQHLCRRRAARHRLRRLDARPADFNLNRPRQHRPRVQLGVGLLGRAGLGLSDLQPPTLRYRDRHHCHHDQRM